jgi:hypothetical protein
MSPELIGAVCTGLSVLLASWNKRQGTQLKELRGDVSRLSGWQTTARDYIGQLLFVMAVHGVKPPLPPAELGLTIPTADIPPEE